MKKDNEVTEVVSTKEQQPYMQSPVVQVVVPNAEEMENLFRSFDCVVNVTFGNVTDTNNKLGDLNLSYETTYDNGTIRFDSIICGMETKYDTVSLPIMQGCIMTLIKYFIGKSKESDKFKNVLFFMNADYFENEFGISMIPDAIGCLHSAIIAVNDTEDVVFNVAIASSNSKRYKDDISFISNKKKKDKKDKKKKKGK